MKTYFLKNKENVILDSCEADSLAEAKKWFRKYSEYDISGCKIDTDCVLDTSIFGNF